MRRPITRRSILRGIAHALAEAQRHATNNPGNECSRGYMIGLRVAYLYAGGKTDGSDGWEDVKKFSRRRPKTTYRIADNRRVV